MPSDNGLEDVQGVSVDNVVHNATASDNGCVSGADNSGVSKIFSTKKINVVLNDKNYLLWHQQVLHTIKTHRFRKFIDGNVTWPSQYVNKDGVVSINPEYELYEEQDGALASWLLSTVSEEVLPHLIGHNTASEIWNTLHRLYSGKTTSRLMTYRRLLHSQKKGELTMRDYLMKLKSVCDSLASCGEIISEQEHVTAILNGLPPEYDSVITVITTNPSPLDLRTVRTILLDAESRQVSLNDQYLVSAHVVVQQQQQTTSTSHAQSIQPAYTNSQGSEDRLVNIENSGFNTSDNSSGVYRGRGRGRFSSSKPQCQLCGKPGHLVERCYRRFDISFKNDSSRAPQHSGNRTPQALYSVMGSDGVTSGNMMYYPAPVSHHVPQLSSNQSQLVSHHVSQLPPIQNQFVSPQYPTPGYGQLAQYLPAVAVAGSTMLQQPSTPQALLATPEVVDDNAWYPDSGATHHLTKDVSNLQVGNTYPSTGMVQVGNGNTIPIRFVGQSVLLNGSRNLHLRNLLYVPNITKNLLSVSKFTQDNQVLLEFYPKCCKVKDLVTKEVLLEGSESGGLYQLDLSSFQSNSTANNHSVLLNKVACHKPCKAGTFPVSLFKQQKSVLPSLVSQHHSLHATPPTTTSIQSSPSPSPQLHTIPPTSPSLQLASPSLHSHSTSSDSSPQQTPSPSPFLHVVPSASLPLQSPSPSSHLHATPPTPSLHRTPSSSSHSHATPSDPPPQHLSPSFPQLHATPPTPSPHQSPSPSSHSHAIPYVSPPHVCPWQFPDKMDARFLPKLKGFSSRDQLALKSESERERPSMSVEASRFALFFNFLWATSLFVFSVADKTWFCNSNKESYLF
ncbi:hypothetical protein GQ457_14G000900 [Hibiscus cannabinus]